MKAKRKETSQKFSCLSYVLHKNMLEFVYLMS